MIEKLEAKLVANHFKRTDDLMKAIKEFLKNEKFVLKKMLNERTLTHKLAEYLQKHFPDYNVDCEYNRMMLNEDYVKKTLRLPADETVEISDTTQKTVYPDIIIHNRGNNEDNLLVIEVKKSENTSQQNRNFDSEKLKAFTKELNYKLGMYLEFDQKKISYFALFKDGEKIGEPND